MSKSTDWSNLRPDGTPHRTVIPSRTHEQDLTGHVLERGGYDYLTLPAPTELDALLDRVREDKRDTTGKNRNVVAYDCWRMFEDLAVQFKEESTMRDRYKRQSNAWMSKAFEIDAGNAELLKALRQMRREFGAFGTLSGETLIQADDAIAKAGAIHPETAPASADAQPDNLASSKEDRDDAVPFSGGRE